MLSAALRNTRAFRAGPLEIAEQKEIERSAHIAEARAASPARPRVRRPKLFSDGKQEPISRDDRGRIMALARSARKAGRLTFSAVAVLEALLYTFANLKDGRCFPGHKRIATVVHCDVSTVKRGLKRLEALGFVTWANRYRWARKEGQSVWRVERTSNSYDFPLAKKRPAAPPASTRHKGHFDRGTIKQVFSALERRDPKAPGDLDSPDKSCQHDAVRPCLHRNMQS